MKRNLIRHQIESHTPEWYEFRKNGVGSSEIGTILGLNPYQLGLSLFLEKIGYRKPFNGNNATYFGTIMEEVVADSWERYEPGREDSLNHFMNPKWDWMFTSPDRIANKGQLNQITGEEHKDEFIVECKTAVGFVLKKWEAGVPPTYVAQVQQQMMVTELDYAEIAILGDGRNLEVFPLEPSTYMYEVILDETESFWDKVKKGKLLMEEYKSCKSESGKELIMDNIYDIAPRPKEGQEELYKEFLNERYKEKEEILLGDDETLTACVEMNQLDAVQKQLKKMIEARKNVVREYMGGSDMLNFDLYDGRITWKTNAKGNRVFTNKVKTPVDVEGIIQHIKTSI
jgi:putative phage-type endonuclease